MRSGGTLVCSYFTGVVDENGAVHLGGYPGAFRDILGVRAEEFLPLLPGQKTKLSSESKQIPGGTASRWAEDLHLDGAETVLTHRDGPAAGRPAVTRNSFGEGTAWYLATAPDQSTLGAVLRAACADAGLALPVGRPAGVECVRRVGPDGAEFDFLINHTEQDAVVPLGGEQVTVPAGRVRVVVSTS